MSDKDYAHEPLPYVVRVRTTLGEDSVPDVQERHVTAYSLYEAMFQAVVEATGTAPDAAKYVVEHIGPDLPAYTAAVVANRLAELANKLKERK